MTVMLRDKPFDPWLELAQVESRLIKGKHGACASFVGTMRDFNLGDSIQSMSLEHYPAMTQKFLENICTKATERWDLVHCCIIHRYGTIKPGEPIVLTAAWSGHRAEAFDACRFLIEELKARAPFWKKETTTAGNRWVHDTSED